MRGITSNGCKHEGLNSTSGRHVYDEWLCMSLIHALILLYSKTLQTCLWRMKYAATDQMQSWFYFRTRQPWIFHFTKDVLARHIVWKWVTHWKTIPNMLDHPVSTPMSYWNYNVAYRFRECHLSGSDWTYCISAYRFVLLMSNTLTPANIGGQKSTVPRNTNFTWCEQLPSSQC